MLKSDVFFESNPITMKICVLLLITLIPQVIYAQMVVTPISDVPVFRQNQSEIRNPWTGGMNAAQISKFDADYDEIEDELFIFDKVGNRILIFSNEIVDGEIVYNYRPELSRNFPNLKFWALLRDYDCDGQRDIFTYSPVGGSFAVYRNTGSAETGISFEPVNESVQSYYAFNATQFTTNIYVSSQDIPAIFDFDGDGDLDILTFGVNGTMVELHLNYSVENTGNCGLDHYELKNKCYGRFIEGNDDNGINIDPAAVSAACNFNVVNPKSNDLQAKGARHVGSTILTLDGNQNGLIDIILGDVGFKNLVYLENHDRPDPKVDSVGSVVTDFPANFGAPAVDLDNFPAGFYEDIDGDGIKDLIVSVNSTDGAANTESIWYYRNNGADDLPDFELIQTDFLQGETIDFGEASAPAFFDYNGDGLMDMVIGSRGKYIDMGNYQPTLSLFINTGTSQNPAFTLHDPDWLSISTLNIGQYITPTFGDLDGDGDEDLVVGCMSGVVYLFENTAGSGNTATFSLSGNIMADSEVIDVGLSSAPQLFDLNQDGKLDLIIGERDGKLNYYQNTGTSTHAQFTLITDNLGGVSSVEPNYFVGNSSPHFYRFNGETYLAVGGEAGKIHLYNGIDDNLEGEFNLISLHAFSANAGLMSKPYVIDINSDGIPDVFVGTIGGGINLLMGDYLVGLDAARIPNKLLKVYPNPATDKIRIDLSEDLHRNAQYKLFSLSGKMMQTGVVQDGTIEISGLASGMYILEVETAGTIYRGKVVRENTSSR